MVTVQMRARQLQSRHAEIDRTESSKSIGQIPGTEFHEKNDESHAKMNE